MNRFFLLVLVVVIFVFFGFALTQKTEQSYTVKVDLPAMKALEYFSDTSKISHWMVPFTREAIYKDDKLILGQDTLVILRLSAYSIDFRRTNHDGSLDFTMTVVPDKDSASQSYFHLTYILPRWKNIAGSNLGTDAKSSLDSLKQFLSNPVKLYGFKINPGHVTDTTFLFAKKTIDKKDFAPESKALFDMLIKEAGKRGVVYTGVRIFHFQDNGDKRTIFASIGINKSIVTKETDSVSLKKMPYNLNLLTIDYNGTYKDIAQAYQAMYDYKTDNRYVTMAIPFQKYLDPGYGYSDSDQVHILLCYPVF